MMNIAVILAGGVGSRLGYGTPKQFFKVAGKTVIEHTIDVFEKHNQIDEIAVVINKNYIAEIENFVLVNEWKKVKKILLGGDERYLSSLSAIQAYEEFDDCNLIFHDAVRPLVNDRIIDDVINALRFYNAVDVAVRATDTIIEVDEKGEVINHIPNRKYLRRGQTPQAFRLKTIKKAYRIALQDPLFESSDDCGTVVKYLKEEKVGVVLGEESNMKLTYKEDAYLLDKLFQLKSTTLSEKSDFSLFAGKTMVVFGGSSGIGKQVVDMATENGAKVYSFSRSTTGTDIAKADDVKSALKQVEQQTGAIHYVVNSSAILSKEPLISMSRESIRELIDTNYYGMINVAVESFNYLKQTGGQLLFYTSSSYTRGRAFYSIYSSTKAAVVNFMQAISQEWENYGIRVNVINPERTNTPMRVKNFGIEPENTLLSTKEVAEVSLNTLLADFTGQVIDVKIKNRTS